MTIIRNIDQLIKYFEKNLQKGYTLEELRITLIRQGYSRVEVERALEKVKKKLDEKEKIKNQSKEKPKIKYSVYDYDNKPLKVEHITPSEEKENGFFSKFKKWFN